MGSSASATLATPCRKGECQSKRQQRRGSPADIQQAALRFAHPIPPASPATSIATRNAGPATKNIVPGITKSSVGKVISTGSRSACAPIRALLWRRSLAAIFFNDWESGVP